LTSPCPPRLVLLALRPPALGAQLLVAHDAAEDLTGAQLSLDIFATPGKFQGLREGVKSADGRGCPQTENPSAQTDFP
jgi:hypothetical protein